MLTIIWIGQHKLRVLTTFCAALKGHAALLSCLLKSTPSLLLFLKAMLPQSMLFQKAFALLGFLLAFRAYLVLSIMFVARHACCFKLLVVTASAGTWLNLQQ